MSAILSTQNLVKKYGYKIVSNNISLMINKGDIYGFVGKNGAGKTTFMRQVLGLAFPDRYYGDS
jgi:ABC-2 type transport system ATP-binding protein